MLRNSLIQIRWKSLVAPWKQVDWLLFALSIALVVFGGISIRSTESNYGVTDWWQHWLVGTIGLGLALFIARCRYENLL